MSNTQKSIQEMPPKINRFYLRHLRQNVVQLTPEQLAEKVNVSPETVRNWETGRTQPNQKQRPVLERFFGLAAGGLAVDIKDILTQDFNAAYFGDEAARERIKWAEKKRKLAEFLDALPPESK